ncbi:uncharacterized protein [Amphiura filiformis]|uniref:uncharacterized protein n=1 Tax=Amphiura filiformis TaxID=82378 RepID=UPI003B215BAF
MVLGADKGRATVVMDKTEYQQKMSTLLSDSKTYEKLDRDPTPKHKRELVSILQRLEKEEKIKKADKQFLYPTSENVPRIYGSPKIHKTIARRFSPIVDFTGSIGYNVAKSLMDILSPIVGQSEHHVLNSKSLAEDLKDVTLEDDEILNSHDVVALFTSTPIDLTLHILKEGLNEDKDLKNRTLLTTDDIIELTKFCLATVAYFSYSGQIYRQCFGMAMGSPSTPLLAISSWSGLSRKLSLQPRKLSPRLWKRYVDDVLEIIRKGQVDNLTDHLNTIDPTGSVKFTYEQEHNGSIPFLDTLITRKPDGSVKLSIYRKKTHTDQYLQFSSHHPSIKN